MTQNDGNDGRIYTTYYIYLPIVSLLNGFPHSGCARWLLATLCWADPGPGSGYLCGSGHWAGQGRLAVATSAFSP